MGIKQSVKTMKVGDVKDFKYTKNPMGKILAIIKASRLYGYFCEIKQDNKRKIITAERIE